MVVIDPPATEVSSAEALAHVQAMVGELAIMCVGAGRPDVALRLQDAVVTLRRPLRAQPPEPKAAPGDAA